MALNVPELTTLESDIGLLIWRLITRVDQALFFLKIKKKRKSSIILDINHSKVPSSGTIIITRNLVTRKQA